MLGVSDLLYNLFLNAKKEYEDALRRGNLDLAKKKAYECANYLTELAKQEPEKKALYVQKAKEFLEVAKKLENGTIIVSAKEETTTTKVQKVTRDSKIDGTSEFEEYVKSFITKTTVTWDDIGGLDKVKALLKVNYVLAAIKKPEMIKPWRGILLFGPPGTGKTLLASALAGSLNATFFNVHVPQVLSKYFGESGKIISALYEVARKMAPSVIFIDEIDSIASKREGEISEASRRVLTTLLAEMDGLKSKKSEHAILTLGATNKPWDLDEAIVRRFQMRIYVPLPDEKATKQILELHLRGLDTSKINWDEISKECVSRLYSGSDLEILAQEATLNMILRMNPNLEELAERPVEDLKRMSIKISPILMEDFEKAFKKVKTSLTKSEVEKYERWAEEFGTKI